MCGIAGYIGKSKNNSMSFSILSCLFNRVESRGIDAAGYWMSEFGENGKVHYHKQPGKSSSLVASDKWLRNSNVDANIALVHARGASKGSGNPLKNQNNHPFVSKKRNLAVIHNGKVDDHEYHEIIQRYSVGSECDSEVFLRIFEQAAHIYSDSDLDAYVGDMPERHRMAGIKDIFSLINESHMAVGIGEWKPNNSRNLWLFRNRYRPLWVSDLRSELGQVFFFSEPSIWRESALEIGDLSLINAKISEVPEDEVWHFQIDNQMIYAGKPTRHMVVRTDPRPLQQAITKFDFAVDDVTLDVVTTLNEEVQDESLDEDDKLLNMVDSQIKRMTATCQNIYATSQVLLRCKSMGSSDMKQLVQMLEEQISSLSEIERLFG